MERTGILHVEPNAPLLPTPKDSIQRTLGISEGIYNLFGKHYDNQLKAASAKTKDLEAQRMQRTLESGVGAENAKNLADTQYYPQMQQAKLQNEQAQVQEVMARTGLNYAQAKVAMAHLPLLAAQTSKENRSERGEGGVHAQLFQAYQNAPPGSPQKAYYAALLNKQMGGFAPTSGGGMVPGNPRGGSVPGMNVGGLETNPLGGGSRSTFHQAYDPATGKTIESPTMSSATRNQQRTEATSEMENIEPTLKAGFQPYMGAGGSLKLGADAWKARYNPKSPEGKAAAQRLKEYNVAMSLKREAANIISRQSAGQAPGVEAAREQESATFRNLPFNAGNYLTPPSVLQGAQDEYFVRQKALADAATNQEREGYQRGGAVPPWSGQGEAQSRGGFGANGYVPPQERVASGFSGNPNLPPQQEQSAQQQPAPESVKNIDGNEYVKINGKWYHK